MTAALSLAPSLCVCVCRCQCALCERWELHDKSVFSANDCRRQRAHTCFRCYQSQKRHSPRAHRKRQICMHDFWWRYVIEIKLTTNMYLLTHTHLSAKRITQTPVIAYRDGERERESDERIILVEIVEYCLPATVFTTTTTSAIEMSALNSSRVSQ